MINICKDLNEERVLWIRSFQPIDSWTKEHQTQGVWNLSWKWQGLWQWNSLGLKGNHSTWKEEQLNQEGGYVIWLLHWEILYHSSMKVEQKLLLRSCIHSNPWDLCWITRSHLIKAKLKSILNLAKRVKEQWTLWDRKSHNFLSNQVKETLWMEFPQSAWGTNRVIDTRTDPISGT